MIDKEQHINNFLVKHFGWKKEKLPFKTVVKIYPKGTHLIGPGMVEENVHFLISGIVEVVILNKKGEEKILDLVFPRNFFCSMSSLLTKEPTDFYMKCVTECKIETLVYNELMLFSKKSNLLNEIIKKLMAEFYLFRIKRETDILTKDGTERYLELIKKGLI